MYKTPVPERKQRTVTAEYSAKTPADDLNKSVVEPSVLNTPEEPGKVFSACYLNALNTLPDTNNKQTCR